MFSVSVAGGLAGGGEGTPVGGGGGSEPAALAEHDPLWEYVVLYTKMEADPPTDLSASGHTFTNSGGGASLDTSVFRFGAGSGLFDGTANADFWTADSNDWNLTNQPFTIDIWLRTNTVAAGVDHFLSHYNTSPNKQFQVGRNAADIRFVYSTTGSDDVVLDHTIGFVASRWYHVALDRDPSGIFRVFVNGKLMGVNDLSGVTFASPNSRLHISNRDFGTGNEWDGNIDEVRITLGKNRYG